VKIFEEIILALGFISVFSSLLGFLVSSLAYPNLLGTKGYVVVVVEESEKILTFGCI
jgi:hypothetical protein